MWRDAAFCVSRSGRVNDIVTKINNVAWAIKELRIEARETISVEYI